MKNKSIFLILLCFGLMQNLLASSHREAPLISNDPLADNTDLYAFVSPDEPGTVTIIAAYVPMQLPHGGPNYYGFGENIRYEIHIDNNIATAGDDIIYRFTFHKTNEDPSTFFYIRLGAQNHKTTYRLEKSIDGGLTFETIIEEGVVPPNNIGSRSIEGPAGLNTTYADLISGAIMTTNAGEKVFCGPSDDPFFVDLGGVFDLGDLPRQDNLQHDGVACLNVSTIALKIPIQLLQKNGKTELEATSILDPDFVIGVWASASRKMIRTLNSEGSESYSGDWVQVSRLGMPLTNEAVIPIGFKDYWNALTPYDDLNELDEFGNFFYNPELALYMDESQFGGAVPALAPLRIQSNSLGAFDFRNGKDGLYGLKGNTVLAGTALDDAIFGTLLLPAPGSPRSVDLWPIFHTGVPNLIPYQLATGKNGNPLAAGKPFINNFLPNGGDMLRLNMAVPATPRNDPDFSSLGLLWAAVLGLTDANYNTTTDLQFIPNMDGFPNGRRLEDDVTRIELQAVGGIVLAAVGLWYDELGLTDANYNTTTDLQFIPNMDGFPNGRRLEDDVTRIELQAVGGIVLAAVGLWYDDYDPMTSPSPVTPQLMNVLSYDTKVGVNDVPFKIEFPYVQEPHSGTSVCSGEPNDYTQPAILPPSTTGVIGLNSPDVFAKNQPNPFSESTVITYHLRSGGQVSLMIFDAQGKMLQTLVNESQTEGNYDVTWDAAQYPSGIYMGVITLGKTGTFTFKLNKTN